MSNFIELRQPDMQAEMVAFAEGSGLAVITLADFLRIRTDSILTRDRKVDREAYGLADPGPEYRQRVLRNAATAAIELVGLDLYDLYRESRVAPHNRDFNALGDERKAIDRYINASGVSGNQTPVTLVDSGSNLLGFGVVVQESVVRFEATSTRFRRSGVGEYITEGTLLAGFVKRRSKELSGVMAEGLLGVAESLDRGGIVLAPHTKYRDNGVSERLLELTDHADVQSGKLIGVHSGANRILASAEREVVKQAS